MVIASSRDFLCCHQGQALLLQDSIYSNTGLQKEEESLDSNLRQQNLTKVDVFTSALLYSVHLQESSICRYFTPHVCTPIHLAVSLACSCEPDFWCPALGQCSHPQQRRASHLDSSICSTWKLSNTSAKISLTRLIRNWNRSPQSAEKPQKSRDFLLKGFKKATLTSAGCQRGELLPQFPAARTSNKTHHSPDSSPQLLTYVLPANTHPQACPYPAKSQVTASPCPSQPQHRAASQDSHCPCFLRQGRLLAKEQGKFRVTRMWGNLLHSRITGSSRP